MLGKHTASTATTLISSWLQSNPPGTGDMLGGDSMIAKIDQSILDFWFTSPNERAWAYLATFIPLLGATVGIASLF